MISCFRRPGSSSRKLGRGVGGWLALAILAASPGFAQEEAPATVATRPAALVLGARFGTPLRVSASAGVILGSVESGEAAYDTASGWLIQAEAGAGGGKLALGKAAALLYGPFEPYAGGALKAVLVRTWGDPLGDAEPRRSFAGAEVDLALLYVKLSFGALRRLGSERSGEDRWLFTWGLGIGF